MRNRSIARHVAVGGILLCVGCAAVGGGPETLTPDEQRLRQESAQLQRNMLQGGLVGAALGGLVGAVAGRDIVSAAIGTGAGAIAGSLGGYYVAKRQQDYASEEARIDSMIADVRQDNSELEQYILTAQRVIATDKERIAELDRQYAANEVTLEEAQTQLEGVHKNRELIAETIAGLRSKQKDYQFALEQTQEDNPTADLSEMDQEVEQLKRQIALLEGDLDSLNDALAVSRIG